MSDPIVIAEKVRESVLSPVERISEMLFGLFMALTFVGAVSAATTGREEVRTMFIAALGCNLAWGLVDAIMYLVRTATDRARSLSFLRAVQAARDVPTGRNLVERRLSERFILRTSVDLISAAEIESIRARIAALPAIPKRATLEQDDLLAGLGIFLIVVISTLPVVVPFLLTADVDLAKNVSRAIALSMLFFGGLALGRYAGYGSWEAGLTMVGLGTGLVIVINALGG
jgi:VIT1/CCC1 family predicted Fe2+/Mn2+ transporter